MVSQGVPSRICNDRGIVKGKYLEGSLKKRTTFKLCIRCKDPHGNHDGARAAVMGMKEVSAGGRQRQRSQAVRLGTFLHSEGKRKRQRRSELAFEQGRVVVLEKGGTQFQKEGQETVSDAVEGQEGAGRWGLDSLEGRLLMQTVCVSIHCPSVHVLSLSKVSLSGHPSYWQPLEEVISVERLEAKTRPH